MPPKRPKVTIMQTPTGKQARLSKTLANGRLIERKISPEQAFVRAGKRIQGFNERNAKGLGERFLGNAWYSEAQKRQGIHWNPESKAYENNGKGKALKMPLPTFKQRLLGRYLPAQERRLVESQVDFSLKVFGKNLSPEKRAQARKEISRLISGRQVSISNTLRSTKGSDIDEMRRNGIETLNFFKGKGFAAKSEQGTIYPGIMNDITGRSYMARGFSKNYNASTPIHETLHVLKKLGVIKVDVPFAYAADRLWLLEQEVVKPSSVRKAPSKQELDRTRNGNEEPQWSEKSGNRIGQWVFQNIPQEKRWNYLFERCMGKNHAEAMRAI